jgi:hypothetical protein
MAVRFVLTFRGIAGNIEDRRIATKRLQSMKLHELVIETKLLERRLTLYEEK